MSYDTLPQLAGSAAPLASAPIRYVFRSKRFCSCSSPIAWPNSCKIDLYEPQHQPNVMVVYESWPTCELHVSSVAWPTIVTKCTSSSSFGRKRMNVFSVISAMAWLTSLRAVLAFAASANASGTNTYGIIPSTHRQPTRSHIARPRRRPPPALLGWFVWSPLVM